VGGPPGGGDGLIGGPVLLADPIDVNHHTQPVGQIIV